MMPPRKKLEKINYKSGIDILEAYKARCALLKNNMNRVNLENNNSENINLKVASTSNLNSMGNCSKYLAKNLFSLYLI